MNDYYATLKIQQGRLKWAMRQMGIESAAELARQAGVRESTIGKFLNFRASPRSKKGVGKWRPSVLAISKTLGMEPSELFPDHLDHEIPTNQIASFVERAQLTGHETRQLNPSEECQQAEMEQTLDEVLGTLTDIERTVLNAIFWENKTLEETGAENNIGRKAAHQIEHKALRKLRHPTRLRKLDAVCPFGSYH